MARLAVLLAAVGCGTTAGPPAPAPDAGAHATAHTTRLPAADPEHQAIAVAQAVYPATRAENTPGAVILAPQDPAVAFTAMHRIPHGPVNAPLLYLDPVGRLGTDTLRELQRLRPRGVIADGRTQVYLVGTDDAEVLWTLRTALGLEVRVFPEPDPVALAEAVDRWRAALMADYPDEVVISALDHRDGIAHGLATMAWNAHAGKGFAWVWTDRVPDETRAILERRQREAYVYLTGPEEVIGAEVAVELSAYGLVRRIAGDDPFRTSAVNAGYKDVGRNFGWWVGQVPRDFGWGVSGAGHNFVVVNADQPLRAIPAAALGRLGKHGPMLLVAEDHLPAAVRDYLEQVRPSVAGPSQTQLNHAWIVGDEAAVSWDVQREIDLLLRVEAPPSAVARTGGGP